MSSASRPQRQKICPAIGHAYATKREGLYRCAEKECRKDFTVTMNTVMERSKIAPHKWVQGFALMTASKKGISAHPKTEKVHTNSAEGYFSIFRRGMRGVYQHCDEKQLHRYLAEYDFRYIHRTGLGFNDGGRAALAVENAAGKRLTYRQPH
jgi:transposase-like protein